MSEAPAKPSKPRWMALARLAVSVAALAVILSIVSPAAVWRAILSVGPVLWLTALALYLLGHVVSTFKWRILAAPHASFPMALRAHFSGLLANLALPGVASGDVVRAGVLFRDAKDRATLAMGSLADRLIDTLGLLLIALVGWAMASRPAADGTLMLWIGGLAALVVIGAVVGRMALPAILNALPKDGRLWGLAQKLGAALLSLLRRPDRLAVCLVLSLAVQAVFIQVNVAMGQAAGVTAPVGAWFFAWPLSKIIATVPISAGGVGVREASLAGLMAPFGAEGAAVVAAGLVWQSIVIAGALAGAAASWFTRPSRQEAAAHGA